MPVARAAGSSRVGRSLPGLSVAPGISVGPMMASPSPIDHIGHSPYQAEMTGAYMTRVGQGESEGHMIPRHRRLMTNCA